MDRMITALWFDGDGGMVSNLMTDGREEAKAIMMAVAILDGDRELVAKLLQQNTCLASDSLNTES